jgi:hypothetical protein
MSQPIHFNNTSFDAIAANPSPPPQEGVPLLLERLKLYEIENQTFHNLKHIQEASREELKVAAQRSAERLAELTRHQAYVDMTMSLIKGGLAIAGVTQAEPIQKLLTGVSEAVGLLNYTAKTQLDAKKIPLQTELDLTRNKISELDGSARGYFDALRELKEALRRLAEMEMEAVHTVHR